jgi:hypothetical protein
MIRLPSQYKSYLSPHGATDHRGFGKASLDHMMDHLSPIFFPRLPVTVLPIQKSH